MAALGMMMAMPALLTTLMSAPITVFGIRPGFHVYDASAEGPGLFGVLLTLAAVSATCWLGEAARRRWRLLSWAWPLVPGVVIGAWVAFASKGGEIQTMEPILIGLVVGIPVSLLVATYWSVLCLMPLRPDEAG
jgi:hypothetical protein